MEKVRILFEDLGIWLLDADDTESKYLSSYMARGIKVLGAIYGFLILIMEIVRSVM